MKKRVIRVSFIFCLVTYSCSLRTSFDEDIFAQANTDDTPENVQEQEQEDFFPDLDSNQDTTSTSATEHYYQRHSVPQQTILSLITSTPNTPITPLINMPALLKNNIYRRTHPITVRSLLDLPSLEPFWFIPCNWSFTAQPFYNQTSRTYFAHNSPFLVSYLDLANTTITRELTTTLKHDTVSALLEPEAQSCDLQKIFSLFHGITLQQRRLGIMFGFSKQFNTTILSLMAPLYYLENNFFINPDQVDQIKFNPFLRTLNADGSAENSNEEEVRELFIRHLLSDRIGIGDTRVRLMHTIHSSEKAQAWFGILFTVPTATSFTRGILGGRFDDYAGQPQFSLQRIFDLTPLNDAENRSDMQQTMATAELLASSQQFLLSALDRLSTVLLNTKLGNNRHTGIGPRFDMHYFFNDYFGMHTTAEFEYYTRRKQQRFFRIIKKKHDFERNFQEPKKHTENIKFLNTQIINTLFPVSICVNVHPGFRVEAKHWFTYDSLNWHGSLGFDFWYQHHETLEGVSRTCAKKQGVKQAAYQGKAFGAFGYYGSSEKHRATWNVLFTGDITCIHKNIGSDFTLGIRIGVDF